MATGGGSEAKNNPHGMDKEIWAKLSKKFDPTRAVSCLNWISQVCNEELPPQGGQSVAEWFATTLKDGYFLTKLMLTLHPDCKKNVKGAKRWKAKRTTMPFKCREHIDLFAKSCKDLGMAETDVVTAQDVYEMENPNSLLNALYSLNALVINKGWSGPTIEGSFKHATENNRHFSEEVLRKGKNTMSKWAEGSINHQVGGVLDGQGIVKTAGNEGYKASSELSTWEKGSIAHKDNDAVDMIIRTKANDDWQISGEVPLANQGTRAYKDDNKLDGYGIVRQAQN